jgi:phosphatidate phosphatase APP1
LGDRVYEAGTSVANGHFRAALKLPASVVEGLVGADRDNPDWLAFEAVTRPGDHRTFAGRVQLIGPQGLSVISDVDDTIKMSNVSDRQALLRNTFLRPFAPVEGASAVYRQWAAAGAAFHYVSASPWQLYVPLSQFLEDQGFPSGSCHLKLFRLKDASALEFFASQERYKSRVIEKILADFPDRRFVLVGDSGEQVPEIYGALAREHPGQIVRILIRSVDGSTREDPRYQAAFAEISGDRWRVFGGWEALRDVLPARPPRP